MDLWLFPYLSCVNRATIIHIEVRPISLGCFVCVLVFHVLAHRLITYTKAIKGTDQHQTKRHVGQGPKQGIQMPLFELEVSLDVCPRLGLLYCMRTPFYIFEETPILFFIIGSTKCFLPTTS